MLAYAVGTPSEEVKNLMDVTKEAMYIGIKQAVVGNRIGDIGAAFKNTLKVAVMVSYVIWLVMELVQLCTRNQWSLTTVLQAVDSASVKEWC